MDSVKNQKGGQCLVYEGYVYKKNGKSNGDTSYWLCTKYNSSGCRSQCKTVNGEVEVRNSDHNHTANASGVEARSRLAEMKELKFDASTKKLVNKSH